MRENKIIHGDSLRELKLLKENSVDAVVTDPPYGLSFMGKKWDYDVPSVELWRECMRVMKPGAFLLSFAGTRTYHRMAVNIEDAGFEIRDMISWLYGSGFPKSLNIGKQIDKIQGNEREVGDYRTDGRGKWELKMQKKAGDGDTGVGHADGSHQKYYETKGNSEWEGWGTALKPACEPIVVARKPLSEKNVALNVLKWGTGGINIDECRIETEEVITNHSRGSESAISKGKYGDSKAQETHQTKGQTQERFPANVILDEEAGEMLDEQAPKTGAFSPVKSGQKGFGGVIYGKYKSGGDDGKTFHNEKLQGASRFFYCAKASKSERNFGCDELSEKRAGSLEFRNRESEKGQFEGKPQYAKNNHPTVKPIRLMEYLVKLVSREGATVLDPFAGSGTTLIACIKLNRKGIGIEKEEDYIKIIQARIKPFADVEVVRTERVEPEPIKEEIVDKPKEIPIKSNVRNFLGTPSRPDTEVDYGK